MDPDFSGSSQSSLDAKDAVDGGGQAAAWAS